MQTPILNIDRAHNAPALIYNGFGYEAFIIYALGKCCESGKYIPPQQYNWCSGLYYLRLSSNLSKTQLYHTTILATIRDRSHRPIIFVALSYRALVLFVCV